MLRKQVTMAARYLIKYRLYSFLNIAGLAAGLYCVLLIILWVDRNISMDRFHENGRNIYRVLKNSQSGNGQLNTSSALPGPLAPALTREVPEIRDAIRLTWTKKLLFTKGEKSFFEYGFYADSSFFQVFSFNLVQGNPSSVLNDPFSVTISEKLAHKYFGRSDVIGETVIINNDEVCIVTGVFRDVPAHSSITFDYVLPFSKYYKENKSFMDRWDNNDLRTFILTYNNEDQETLAVKMTGVIQRHYADAGKKKISIFGQSLESMYLYGDFKNSWENPTGIIVRVRIMVLVAIFIILLACFNYINMATAISIRRSGEVSLKLTFGADRKSLVIQFLTEAIALTITAFIISLLMIRLSLPLINRMLHENLGNEINSPAIKILVFILPFLVGSMAGLIPALKLSSLESIRKMKSYNAGRITGRLQLRHFLIVAQFVITITFIIISITVFRQVKYLRNKDLGLNKENVMFFQLPGDKLMHRDALKSELKLLPGVADVSYVFNNPLNVTSHLYCSGKNPDDEIATAYMVADKDFTSTLNIEIVDGSDCVEEYPDNNTYVLINQELAHSLGYENPVGQPLKYRDNTVTIIGIVKNFHFNNLRIPVGQLMIFRQLEGVNTALIRIDPHKIKETISAIEKKFKEFGNNIPFEYSFMDDLLDNRYRDESSMENLVDLFTMIAIIISCTGLFGLALFTTEQRTKEMGIRKTFGSGSSDLLNLLLFSFFKWIMISFAISVLISHLILIRWLQGFAYHIPLNAWIFLVAGFFTALLTLLTVSWKCWHTATRNPLDSLKYE
jgi:putative ABC transport system permease protein